jgi:hypothetical protein
LQHPFQVFQQVAHIDRRDLERLLTGESRPAMNQRCAPLDRTQGWRGCMTGYAESSTIQQRRLDPDLRLVRKPSHALHRRWIGRRLIVIGMASVIVKRRDLGICIFEYANIIK